MWDRDRRKSTHIKTLAIVVLATHAEFAAHAKGGARERQPTLGLVLVPKFLDLPLLLALFERLERIAPALPRDVFIRLS